MKFLCIPHASEYTKKEQKSITFCDNLCCAYCFTSVLKQWFLGHFNSSLLHGKYLISAVISPLWYKKVVSVSLSELKTNLGAKIGEKIGGDMTVEVYIYNIIIFVASNEGMHDVAWKGGARPNIISAFGNFILGNCKISLVFGIKVIMSSLTQSNILSLQYM